MKAISEQECRILLNLSLNIRINRIYYQIIKVQFDNISQQPAFEI